MECILKHKATSMYFLWQLWQSSEQVICTVKVVTINVMDVHVFNQTPKDVHQLFHLSFKHLMSISKFIVVSFTQSFYCTFNNRIEMK